VLHAGRVLRRWLLGAPWRILCSREDPMSRLDRRQFLSRSAAAALGIGAGGLAGPAWSAPGEPRIRRRRRLGRTGIEMSDISFGSSRSADPALIRHALDLGVNYFDTAEGYKGGRSEEAIGEALAGGERERVFLASKVKCGTSDTLESLMSSLEGSLRRLRTDRIDVYFNHAVNEVERLQNPSWGEFVTRAREQGKIRFTGVSGHGGGLAECLDFALDHDLCDVILCAYNFGQDPSFYERFTSKLDWIAVQTELPRLIEKASAKQVGVIAMKTLRGARLNDMRPFEGGGASYAQAALRWVLSNPKMSGLIISMKTREQIDEYVAASGAPPPEAGELDLLEDYLIANEYCEHGCDACESACPHGVAVSEVLRTRMYATDYGDLDYAREDYAKLPSSAEACVSCAVQSCAGRCPSGLDVPRLTASAHRILAPPARAG
jgi:predicted aldo/keto reductase-like oxidoreductase